jgi:beta-galactosidase
MKKHGSVVNQLPLAAGVVLLAGLIFLSAHVKAQSLDKFFPAKDLTTIGVYYYPEHWDPGQWERDFRNMAAMGFEFTHFAEFAWAQLEPEEGHYDFAWLDRALQLAAKHNL